jgi:hypothetical protein
MAAAAKVNRVRIDLPLQGFSCRNASVPPPARLGKQQWNSFLNRLITRKKIQPAPEGAG